MNDDRGAFLLACRDEGAPAPVLAGVQASGRLDGLLFELTLRQTYRNASDRLLEVVYTFPLPPQAVLLGFASELDGARQVGTVVAKAVAERRYEAALAEGDAPVMLEALGDGLHTANIGNLKPGDGLVIEVRFAQVQAIEQGRLRLAIPTTIAPRYGNPAAAGLQPQQVPEASLEVAYPLALSVTVGGALASGTVECPTHRITRSAVDGGLRLDLDAGARLDRDVVLLVQPREPLPALVIQGRDTVPGAAPVLLMAALQPALAAPRPRIALKLLVDCSGSMGGDSIASARVALQGALAGLGEPDCVSLSRFGSTTEHLCRPSNATPPTLQRLGPLVDGIDADLGGTEMEAALQAVFGLPVPAAAGGADVLLITDGEIWNAGPMIAAARASGHRVFAIGVGSAPATSVLRSLAEATGGACEFATPGESLQAAAGRMLVRIRQSQWREARIDWGAEPVWQIGPGAGIFGGDTVIAFAGMPVKAAATAVRLLATDAQGRVTELARGEADAPCPGDTLARLAGARRVAIADAAEARRLAVAYQLMSGHTNCILVHERAAADQATQEAELHRVGSMLAAGWGATGTVVPTAAVAETFHGGVAYRMASYSMDAAPARIERRMARSGPADSLRATEAARSPASLQEMLEAIHGHLQRLGTVQGLAAQCAALELHDDARLALDEAVKLGLPIDAAWLLLAHWVNRRPGGTVDAAIDVGLQPHVARIDADLLARALALFDGILGRCTNDTWALSRTGRLRQAMARSSP